MTVWHRIEEMPTPWRAAAIDAAPMLSAPDSLEYSHRKEQP